MTTDIIEQARSNRTAVGVACGVGAGALWGLVFLAPELARGFNPLQLTVGRYLAYGLIAGLLLAPRWKAVTARIDRGDWLNLFWLALTGNTLYYILLSAAVQTGGIAMTSLVIGFLPVAVTIIGSRDQGAVPLRRLYLPLLLCVGGAVCIGWQALAAPAEASHMARFTGFACAVGALASWTFFAVRNARRLRDLEAVSAHDWSLLTGVVTGAQSLLLPVALLIAAGAQHETGDWMRLAGVSVGVAVLASIVGNNLWNRMSRLLPLTLVGQMILFETLFALIYGFAWEQRLPTMMEALAFVLVVLSVATCLRAHRGRPGVAHEGA